MVGIIKYKKHDILVDDIFSYFKYAQNNNLKFDVVTLDPPSFSTSKNNIFSANKDYKDLVKLDIDITRDNGIILTSTNCALFDMEKFKEFIDTAFKESHKFYEILEGHTLPKDFTISKNFPEGDYLKVLFIKVN